MFSETASKRARRLVKLLFELQLCDQELTGPVCLSVKHILRSSKYCRAVEVLAGFDTSFTVSVERGSVPKFILSQLEAQKLTCQDPTPTVLISPLVQFVLACIPAPLSRQNTVATLFHWQSSSSHRTFCIVAFVDDTATMPSPIYTAEELLRLRSSAVPVSLQDAPQKGVYHANQAGLSGRHLGGESRTLGRSHKFRPHHSQQSSSVRLRDEQPGGPELMFVRQHQRRDARSALPTEMEWRYRGRVGSEVVSSTEPLSAPPGLSAQQSEGFQRFYKAVVSPTHVRVTAGGRIVPNTRGTSPMSKRPKDKADESGNAKNGNQPSDDQTQQPPDGSYLPAPKAPTLPVFAFPPHPFYPPFPASMAAMHMMPMPMGVGFPGGFPYPHQTGASSVPASLPPELAKPLAKENQHGNNHAEAVDAKAPTVDNADAKPRRIPSEHVDLAKPVIMNGPVAYPFSAPPLPPQLPPGSHPQFPPGFVGHPGFPVAAFHNPMIGPPSSGMNPMLGAAFNFSAFPGPPPGLPMNSGPHMQNGQHGQNGQHAQNGQNGQNEQNGHSGQTNKLGQTGPPAMVPAAATSSSGVLQPPTAPPISSIRPSDISRKQIEMLRNSLKYHEDQLLYNRHQIDEKEMEHTIQMLQSQIDRFEALNQSQLRFEEIHYPKREKRGIETNSSFSRTSDRTSQTESVTQGTTKHASSSSSRRSDSVRHKPFLRKKEPCFNLDPVESSLQLTDPVKKSTLPSGAALAPPFEPRAPLNVGKTATTHDTTAFQWDGAATNKSAVSNGNNGASAVGETIQDPSRSSSTASQPDLGKPYLVGTLPAGVGAQTARDGDYVYERELTQDEVRSRYLYWAKAPPFVRQGLPKFDGKDFYPASPEKKVTPESPPPPLLSRRIPIGDPKVDYGTDAFQPRGVQGVRPPVSGSHASSFIINKPKPVKVTLKRPEPESTGANKDHHDAGQPSRPAGAAVGSSERRREQEPPVDSARTKFLHNVLRRNISPNNEVLPGTLTSATAQGVLPQYSTGYESLMAASLGSINSSPATLGQLSPVKSDDGSSVFLTPASRKMGENRPPPDSIGPASLEHQFRDMVSLESKHDPALPVHWSTPL